MSSFAGIDARFVRGKVEKEKQVGIAYNVTGVDGTGFQLIGKRGQPYPITCVQFGTLAVVNNWISQMYATQGQVVQFVNDFVDASGDHFVNQISGARVTPAIGEGGLRAEIIATVTPLT